MAPQAKIWMLGPPRFQVANRDVEFGTRKAVALLAYLAVTGQPQSRETLTVMLWPEYDQASASQALRQTLYTARRHLGKDLLPGIGKKIMLDDSSEVWIDVKEFRAAVDAGTGTDVPPDEALLYLQEAAALYQGDFLAGFTLKDSLEFDDWQSFEANSLRQECGRVLERLVRYNRAHGLHDQALEYALRQVQLDQLDELAHRNVIRAYAETGQRAAALRHYDKYEQILVRHLQIQPSKETHKLRHMIMAEQTIPLQSSPGPSRPVSVHEQPYLTPGITSPSHDANAPKHNLPSLATTFVGRETELADLAKLIDDSQCRLITILAPGGMGKTRLALEMANQIVGMASQPRPRTTFPNGVWFVELAQIQKVEDILATIADAVGFWFQSDHPGCAKYQGRRYLPRETQSIW
jgi:DNA-binding SARP family transcriptional activator